MGELAKVRRSTILGVVAATLSVAALVHAAIPDTGGVVNACYRKNNGQLRVVDDPASCGPQEVALSWSQVGPAGPQGAPGATGPAGPAGPAGPPGSSEVYVATGNMSTSPGGGPTEITSVALPAGSYLFMASLTAIGNDANQFRQVYCQVGPAGTLANYGEGAGWLVPSPYSVDASIAFNAVATLAEDTTVAIRCESAPSSTGIGDAVLVAIPFDSVNPTP